MQRQPALEQRRQLLLGEGLAQEIIHARGKTALAISLHGVGGQRDDGHPRAAGIQFAPAQFRRRRQPIHHRHLAIHQHRVVSVVVHRLEGQPAVFRGMRDAAQALQHSDRHFPVHGIVLDQQDLRHEGARRQRPAAPSDGGFLQARFRRRGHGAGHAIQQLRAAQGLGEDGGEQLHASRSRSRSDRAS